MVQVIDRTEFVKPGTPVGNRLNFKKVIPNRFGFATFTNDIVYFFEYIENNVDLKKSGTSAGLGKSGSNPDLEKKASGALGSTKAKGYYNCVLKWRAEEFRGTEIMDAHIC